MTKIRSQVIKWGIASVLLIFMIIVSGYLYVNYDKMFTSKVEIRYSDNCIEVYDNDIIITPICTEGRRLLEEQKDKNKPEWMMAIELNQTYHP